nr:PaREP1 family protein [Pyrolobus fumarii]
MNSVRLLEQPLPRPRRDPTGYASARVLEALLEALLALRFLEEGYTRNAAGKAFQAWRALTGALLALERDRILESLRTEEERRWLEEKGIPRVPSSRLKPLARLVEEAGYKDYTHYTSTALDLHDYQYHGPDPSGDMSKYPDPEEAARDVTSILAKLTRIVEEHAKPKLEQAGKWTREHREALEILKQKLRRA